MQMLSDSLSERQTASRFLEIILDDAELLRDAFDEIIAGNWPEGDGSPEGIPATRPVPPVAPVPPSSRPLARRAASTSMASRAQPSAVKAVRVGAVRRRGPPSPHTLNRRKETPVITTTANRRRITVNDIRATMTGRVHPDIHVVRLARTANGDELALMTVGPDSWIGERLSDRITVWAFGQYDILADREFDRRLNDQWIEVDHAHADELVAA